MASKAAPNNIGGVVAERAIIVFEILNNLNIWLFPNYGVGYFLCPKVPLQGNVSPIVYYR